MHGKLFDKHHLLTSKTLVQTRGWSIATESLREHSDSGHAKIVAFDLVVCFEILEYSSALYTTLYLERVYTGRTFSNRFIHARIIHRIWNYHRHEIQNNKNAQQSLLIKDIVFIALK